MISISWAMSARSPRDSSAVGVKRRLSIRSLRTSLKGCGASDSRGSLIHAKLTAGIGAPFAELDQSQKDPSGDLLVFGRRPASRASAFVAIATASPLRPSRPSESYEARVNNRLDIVPQRSTRASCSNGKDPGSLAASSIRRSTSPSSRKTPAASAGLTIAFRKASPRSGAMSMIWLRSTGQRALSMRSP